MVTRILHVSDLHVGARHDPTAEAALASLVARIEPELLIASGDLTHRGRADQHERAATLLRGLGVPILAVPGNHDIPYSLPARVTHPWREFERLWETTDPVAELDGALVLGLNSVRPWHHQSGALSAERVARAEQQLRAEPAKLRVVALHHQLVGPPWRTRKRPLARRSAVLAGLAGAGAELIVGGHVHQAAVAERHEFEVTDGGTAAAVVTTAPGLGQPRPHRLGEARGCLAYRADETTLSVDTYLWRRDAWERTATRTFARGTAQLD